MVRKYSKIRVEIYKKGRQWCFHIKENVDEEIDWNAMDRFGDCIDWTIQQLERHPGCVRMAYDQWYFVKRREAEEFRTLWTLKWI